MAVILDLAPTVAKGDAFLGIYPKPTSRPNLVALEQFALNSPFIALAPLTIWYCAVHYKEPLKSVEIRVGHSPGVGLRSVAILP